jgi:hypothetical protein
MAPAKQPAMNFTLSEETKQALKEIDDMQRRSWAQMRHIVLD